MTVSRKTSLYENHKKLGAKLIPFSGFLMPLQYSSIIEEHKHVRSMAGIFDVSHMGEFLVKGDNAKEFLQKVTTNDIDLLKIGKAQYSAICNQNGGIIDDLLIYHLSDYYMLVVNAANIDKDFNWLQSNLIDDVELENISDNMGLLAVQGPISKEILLPLYPQYSAATSGSSILEWKEIAKKNDLNIETSTICCYPEEDKFIKAHIELIRKKIKGISNFKLIFSAHGLPEKNIKKGDPYQWQVEQGVKKIIEGINDPSIDYILSYQSRVGPLKWIGPSTEDVIVENSKIGKHLVIVPIDFVYEHSET